MSASTSTSSIDNEPSSKPNLRTLTPRRSLPGTRSIVGGVLVAVAVLGTYAATTQTAKEDSQSVLIATRDIPPGTRLQPNDFRIVKMALAPSLSDHVAQSAPKLNGATTLGPLRSGDVVQNSLIAISQTATPYLEVSFSVPASRALNGTLQPGETVDVLTTDKSSPSTSARVAATDAHVLRVQNTGNGSIGQSADVTITVGVISRTEAAAIASAVDQGQVTLVRTTGVASNG